MAEKHLVWHVAEQEAAIAKTEVAHVSGGRLTRTLAPQRVGVGSEMAARQSQNDQGQRQYCVLGTPTAGFK